MSTGWVYVVAVLMFAQVIVLLLQDRLGPTFFLFNRVCYSTSLTCLCLMSRPLGCRHEGIRLSSAAALARS